ncbi:MAG: meso-butanediol dehydrogenase/(S,S)-butanediol dehydrogenase/diacetyl reductase [Porticoccaceae bacterium]|jgi:meso-butanediol dehydrogenase/(S,S)-butanediol dehydrogenase/diacetyl reductase|nr:SDR family oxidoreductase [SAR92 clade bacterium]|tara:strand:+ start:4805 stop:5593 length:789 start_codon:yes stop_codon:yes gene_type:complete
MTSNIDTPGSARNLHNKLVLITGGASGVGLECAKHFARLGAQLLLIGRNSEKLTIACEMLTKQFDVRAHSFAGDVRDSAFANAAVAYAKNSLDCTVDVLINNAGTIFRAHGCETEDQQWQDVFDVNVNGVFYFSRAVANQMTKGGAIVNISSTCGSVGSAGLAAYCASKGAVNMLTKTMALELAAQHINVNAVAPGAINSPMLFSKHTDGTTDNSVVERNIASIPIGAIAEPQEVARAVVFLCQEKHITGEIMALDGGYTAA